MAVVCLLAATLAGADFRGRSHGQTVVQLPCDTPCQLQFCAGDQPDDLQVHVTGKCFDTLEMYFRNEVWREQIPGAANLHLCPGVYLARKNPLGTFAVRYGQPSDRVMAFAWFSDQKTKPVSTGELRPFPNEPLSLTWVTDRILKIVPSGDPDRSLIIRFTNEGSKSWQRFDAAANGWKSL